jgi:hypothetical protein
LALVVQRARALRDDLGAGVEACRKQLEGVRVRHQVVRRITASLPAAAPGLEGGTVLARRLAEEEARLSRQLGALYSRVRVHVQLLLAQSLLAACWGVAWC